MKQKVKLLIVLAVEFITIAAILLLIFFAGKKSYTVTFDLNGGTLVSGSTVQRVTQGQSADPPEVAKEGASFRSWSASYRYVTHDIVIKAVWEYATTPGIEYSAQVVGYDYNYCEVTGSYKNIAGDVYIDGLFNGKTVIAIGERAFENRTQITSMYMLDGILDIGDYAFGGCVLMRAIEIPSTVLYLGEGAMFGCVSIEEIVLPKALKSIGDSAFAGCEKLSSVVLEEGLYSIGANAFAGCEALEEVIIPKGVQQIGANAFDANTVIKVPFAESEKPQGWAENCFGEAQVIWEWSEEISNEEQVEKSR